MSLKPRSPLAWVLVALGVLIAAGALVIGVAVVWEDTTAVSVTFVNDSQQGVILPDCGTDLVSISPHETVQIPIATDHPKQCSVDTSNGTGRNSTTCLAMPTRLDSKTIIRISGARPQRATSGC